MRGYATGGLIKSGTQVPTIDRPCELRVCRWCRKLAIPHTPCSCDRAQEEARRIRAGS